MCVFFMNKGTWNWHNLIVRGVYHPTVDFISNKKYLNSFITKHFSLHFDMDGLVQDCSISSALAMKILQSVYYYNGIRKTYFEAHSI